MLFLIIIIVSQYAHNVLQCSEKILIIQFLAPPPLTSDQEKLNLGNFKPMTEIRPRWIQVPYRLKYGGEQVT